MGQRDASAIRTWQVNGTEQFLARVPATALPLPVLFLPCPISRFSLFTELHCSPTSLLHRRIGYHLCQLPQ